MSLLHQFNTAPDPQGFTLPLTKVAVSAGSAVAVNTDRISDAMTGTAIELVTHPLLQLTWQNFAAFTATLVSVCVLWDWWWKRFWRPFAERRGWLAPKPVKRLTQEQIAEILGQTDGQG